MFIKPQAALCRLAEQLLDEGGDPLLLESHRQAWLRLTEEAIEPLAKRAAGAAQWCYRTAWMVGLTGLVSAQLLACFDRLSAQVLVMVLVPTLLCASLLMVRFTSVSLLADALAPLAQSQESCEQALSLVRSEAMAAAHRDDVVSRGRILRSIDLTILKRIGGSARRNRLCLTLHGVEDVPPFSTKVKPT